MEPNPKNASGGTGTHTRLDNGTRTSAFLTLMDKRPDLRSNRPTHGPLSLELGILAEADQLDSEWRIRPRNIRDYERCF